MFMMSANESVSDEALTDESAQDKPAYTYESLSAYTKAELLEIANELGITGLSS